MRISAVVAVVPWSSRYAPYETYPSQNPDMRISRIRLFTKLIPCLSRINIYINLWLSNRTRFNQLIKTVPVVAPPLTPLIQPEE